MKRVGEECNYGRNCTAPSTSGLGCDAHGCAACLAHVDHATGVRETGGRLHAVCPHRPNALIDYDSTTTAIDYAMLVCPMMRYLCRAKEGGYSVSSKCRGHTTSPIMCSKCYKKNHCVMVRELPCGNHFHPGPCPLIRTLTDVRRVESRVCTDDNCNVVTACARASCALTSITSVRDITINKKTNNLATLCLSCMKTHVACIACARPGIYDTRSAYFHNKLRAIKRVLCAMCIPMDTDTKLSTPSYVHASVMLHMRMARNVMTKRIMLKPWDLAIVYLNWNSYTARERDELLTNSVFREKSHRLFPLLEHERIGELMYRCALLPRDMFEFILERVIKRTT